MAKLVAGDSSVPLRAGAPALSVVGALRLRPW